MSGARLGSFILNRPIGEGGMARVWSATRQDNGAQAAVKVLTTAHSTAESYRAALRNEVRAAAGLEHPNIVLVLDYGEVDAAAAESSAGALIEGTPWLAMEYARGGALRRHQHSLEWETLRRWLLALLSALGHAHARGVIHRDIKPANLLLSDDTDLRPGLKVTDFGLAYAAEWSGHPAASAGTPAYMAPEQRAGRVREYGPWTDLYAVGRTALALLTGSPSGEDNAIARLPEGFTGWLGRLLAPNPADRFQRAADAAWALRGLRGPLSWVDTPLTRAIHQTTGASALSTMIFDADTVLPEGSGSASTLLLLPEGVDAGAPLPPIEIPPLPMTAPLPPPPPPASLRAGPRLAPLRHPPLLGRAEERAALWASLQAVSSSSTAAVVLLEGPAGVGKSRLARWICETIEETGGAHSFRALHSPDAAPGAGLATMLERALAAQDIIPEALLLHLAAHLRPFGLTAPEDLRATAALISPTLAAPFSRPAERYTLIQRLLLALSSGRPAVVWLDDVQWSPEALDFTCHLLDAPRGNPVLFVLTAQDEALAERPVEARRVAALRAHPRTRALRLGPLPDETHRALVEALLGFESDLAAALTHRTAGNPLFAVQLVQDWAQRGVLEAGPRGWRLAPGAQIPLPDDLYAVWADRLGRLVRTPDEQGALELAATLGAEVRMLEWSAACAHAGLVVPEGLVERLLEQRLAEAEDPLIRWAFPHAMARESLTRTSTEQGRDIRWHRACADALIPLRERVGAERIGHHLLAAGALAEALPWLLEGAEARRTRGDHGFAQDLLDRYQEAAQAIALPPTAVACGRGWALSARIAVERGALEPARAFAQAALAGTDPEVRAQGAQVMGRLAHQEGRLHDAIAHFQEAIACGAQAADPHLEAAGWALMAGSWLQLDAMDEVARCHQAGLAYLASTAHPSLQEEGRIWYNAAGVAIKTGRPQEAILPAERALNAYTQIGHRVGVARCLNLLGEAARADGDLNAAERYYRQAIDRYRRVETWQAAMPLANLGLLLLERGEYAAARSALQDAVDAFEESRMHAWVARVRVCLLPCAAADADFSAVADHLQLAEDLLAAGVSAAEWSLPAARAAALLSAAGQTTLATRAQRLITPAPAPAPPP